MAQGWGVSCLQIEASSALTVSVIFYQSSDLFCFISESVTEDLCIPGAMGMPRSIRKGSRF